MKLPRAIYFRLNALWGNRQDTWARYIQWGIRTFPAPVRGLFWTCLITAAGTVMISVIIGALALLIQIAQMIEKRYGNIGMTIVFLSLCVFNVALYFCISTARNAGKKKRDEDAPKA